MMRDALRVIDAHSESTAMIGDRMDTDIVAGMEAGLRTILVLTGISTRETAERFPYRPSLIVESVADLLDAVEAHQFLPPPGAPPSPHSSHPPPPLPSP